ncbi:MAG: hypothetical protein LDL26_00340 [Caenispirillum bisanense]|nr:hypothetical protein [Caenispirillum bisanense]
MQLVRALVAGGTSEPEAVSRATTETGLQWGQIMAAWTNSERRREALDLHARRYMARQLQRAGLDRTEIAELIGCHPNHVPRMVKALDDEESAGRRR